MPTTPVAGGLSAVKAGAEVMVMVIDGLTALGSVPLEAVTVKVDVPAVVGVPARIPVTALNVRPAGKVPLEIEKVGDGEPLALNV